MGNLIKHAESELKKAGLFDKDSDYGGMIGEAVMKMIKTFEEEDHSGFSELMTLNIFNKLARFKLINPIEQPKQTDYVVVNDERTANKQVLQHKVLSSLFSDNGGKDWHDIDAKQTWLDKILKCWHRVKFPYLPK